MSLPRLIRLLLLALVPAALLAASANGALVAVDNLVLRADGGFQPQSLPHHRYAPISFHGRFDISTKDGSRPIPLRQAVIDFDHDGRLTVAGLPTCSPEAIADASTEEARRICRGAIVGTGQLEAMIDLSTGVTTARSPLTVFNGPPLEGEPTVVLHARTTVPGTQTYAILAPIEKRPGRFRYRVKIDLPPIAAGFGALTHLDVKIDRRYVAGGKKRSYVSARCSDNILETRGRFTFEDGTLIEGVVEKFCHAK
jgi:hypothetical protein